MNPYKYSDPPCPNILESPTKLKAKYWPETQMARHHRHKLPTYLTFCIGLLVGMLLTSIIKSLLKQNLCSHPNPLSENQAKFLPAVSFSLKSEQFANGKKQLIFIGVMTANKYLDTRAKAIYETWGKTVPGKLVFFSSENSYTKENIPLIKLVGVDDSYPPQKKSFLMLKYMYDNHLHEFEYFMRADDDMYLRTERLEKFLKSINSSNLYYIGQAGRGNPDEFGHLSLTYEQNFCMGGPGMIFTQATLQKMAPHLRKCLKNLKSFHEDVEIGRCVQKYAGIPCTWSYEMQNIFYHNNSESGAFTGSLNQREVHRAITLHPIKKSIYLHRLHSYVKSLIIKEKEFEIVEAMREIKRICEDNDLQRPSLDNAGTGVFVDHLGEAQPSLWKRRSGSDARQILPWDFSRQNAYNLRDSNPRHRPSGFARDSDDALIRDVMEIINRLSKERGRVIDFKELLYGLRRHDPGFAAEAVLDLLLVYRKYRGRKATVVVRRHAYVQIPFGPLYVREVPRRRGNPNPSFFGGVLARVTGLVGAWKPLPSLNAIGVPGPEEATPVTLIVPLAGRGDALRRFLGDVDRVLVDESKGSVRLIVVSFEEPSDVGKDPDWPEKILQALQSRHPEAEISLIKVPGKFARAVALETGARQCRPEDLLLFIDVDISLHPDALQRVRLHTVLGKQVYYPVVYSEFDPQMWGRNRTDHFAVDNASGYWRAFGFGIVALHNSDLRRVGGLDTAIMGWGQEDVDLFEKVLRAGDLRVVRAPDPGLVHVYHPVTCDPELPLPQQTMCQGSQFSTFASLPTLAGVLARAPQILDVQTWGSSSAQPLMDSPRF